MANKPAEISVEIYTEYAKNFTKPWNQYLIRRILVESSKLSDKPKIILDVGTGTAQTLIDLASRVELLNCKFIGLDFFVDMVQKAVINVKNNNLQDRITLVQGDVHNMSSIKNNSIDIVCGRSVIHHWNNPSLAYLEIYRILREQGICIIHDPARNPTPSALKAFNALRSKLGVEDMNLTNKYTADEVTEQLQSVGLDKVSHVRTGTSLAGLGFELFMCKTAITNSF